LSNPVVYIFLRLCLLIEATGICAGAWFMAAIHKKVSGFQLDEIYVGTAEERAAGLKPDNSIHPGREFTVGTNVLSSVPANWEETLKQLAAVPESFSVRRERILKNISNMKDFMTGATSEAEKAVYESGLELEVKALAELSQEEKDAAYADAGTPPMKGVDAV
jgi:hypothetical protein